MCVCMYVCVYVRVCMCTCVYTCVYVAFDCDGDTLLIQVEQTGAACHEGYKSCFFRSVTEGAGEKITEAQLETPEQIYGKK